MYIDAYLRVSNAQAFTAVAVSTNSIDLGASVPSRQIGSGEPLGFGMGFVTLLNATSLLVEIISADDGALTTGVVVHASRSILAADAPAGALAWLGLPKGTPTKRYLGLRITPVGGAALVTLTAWLTMSNLFSLLPQHYASGFVA